MKLDIDKSVWYVIMSVAAFYLFETSVNKKKLNTQLIDELLAAAFGVTNCSSDIHSQSSMTEENHKIKEVDTMSFRRFLILIILSTIGMICGIVGIVMSLMRN